MELDSEEDGKKPLAAARRWYDAPSEIGVGRWDRVAPLLVSC